MSNPFYYINSINEGKNLVDNGEFNGKEYIPFLTNRNFSNFRDTIFVANMINQNSHIDNDLQYSFYINIIRKRKRFAKWHKKISDDDVLIIANVFNYSLENAKNVLDILSEDDLKKIKKNNNKGGVQNE